MRRFVLGSSLVACVAGMAQARPLITTQVDTSAGNTIGTYNYTGAGSGFGGTVGNGVISLDTDNTNLYVRMSMGTGGLDNLITIMLDSRAGGFRDADMDDQADGGRRAVSQLANAVDDAFDPNFLPDFGLVLGNFGSVLFELNAGNTPGHLNFLSFDGSTSVPVRDFTIPLATLGVGAGGNIDFFVAYTSDSGYMSNESIPAYDPLQSGGNPGFGDGQFGGTFGSAGVGNYNRLTTVPTPGSLALVGLASLIVGRRRRA
jgi:hypothetical protein